MEARVALARCQQQRPAGNARDDAQAFEVGLQEAAGVGVGAGRDDVAGLGRVGRAVRALELVVVRSRVIGLAERLDRLDQAIAGHGDKRRSRPAQRQLVETDCLECDVERLVRPIEHEAFGLRFLEGGLAARRPVVGRAALVPESERRFEQEGPNRPIRQPAAWRGDDLKLTHQSALALGHEDHVGVALRHGQAVDRVLIVHRVVAPSLDRPGWLQDRRLLVPEGEDARHVWLR